MTICVNQCGCAVESSSLNISGSGTPDDPWVIEQAEFTDIAALTAAVAVLQADMTAAQADISAAEASIATLEPQMVNRMKFDGGIVTDNALTTVGTTPLTIATDSLGPFGATGLVVIWHHANYTKTVAGDTFAVTVTGGTSAGESSTATSPNPFASGVGHLVVASPTTAFTLNHVIQRTAGSGTATTGATGHMAWAFIPDPV